MTPSEVEKDAVSRIEKKASALQAADPTLTRSIALGRAVELLPNLTGKLFTARHSLAAAGKRPLPLR